MGIHYHLQNSDLAPDYTERTLKWSKSQGPKRGGGGSSACVSSNIQHPHQTPVTTQIKRQSSAKNRLSICKYWVSYYLCTLFWEGSIAQLVQSICLTSRGSLVRAQVFPLERPQLRSFFICRFCVVDYVLLLHSIFPISWPLLHRSYLRINRGEVT